MSKGTSLARLVKAEWRIIASVALGTLILVIGAIALVLTLPSFPLDPGGFLSGFSFIALFPPFIPAILPSALFARSSKEGAVAGFVVYLIVPIYALVLVVLSSIYIPYYSFYPGPGGIGIIIFSLTPLLGALVGAGGGAIGGWRARRSTRAAKEAKTDSAPHTETVS